jgi:hypothetical protein
LDEGAFVGRRLLGPVGEQLVDADRVGGADVGAQQRHAVVLVVHPHRALLFSALTAALLGAFLATKRFNQDLSCGAVCRAALSGTR